VGLVPKAIDSLLGFGGFGIWNFGGFDVEIVDVKLGFGGSFPQSGRKTCSLEIRGSKRIGGENVRERCNISGSIRF